jgi:inosine/xanthosine triphosphate pyrophosphatase family protein
MTPEPDYKALWLKLKEKFKEYKEDSERSAIYFLERSENGFAYDEVAIAWGYQMALQDMEDLERGNEDD